MDWRRTEVPSTRLHAAYAPPGAPADAARNPGAEPATSARRRRRPKGGRSSAGRRLREVPAQEVSGETMTSAWRQPVQTLARPAQNRRLAGRSLERRASRL